jgi:hypothetical protein
MVGATQGERMPLDENQGKQSQQTPKEEIACL